jgi:uncharacterized phage protein (TIGR01671 family)
MREIKFRAWDPINRVMECNVNVNQGTPVKQGYQWFNKENTVLHSELMQYTGLNDKNGKEIYERDVIEFHVGTWKTVVEFKDGMFICYVPRERATVVVEEILFNVADRCEVIGNIYENPELLES